MILRQLNGRIDWLAMGYIVAGGGAGALIVLGAYLGWQSHRDRREIFMELCVEDGRREYECSALWAGMHLPRREER